MSKYPRTYHLHWSPGATNDDRISNDVRSLIGREIVITEKLDGENSGMTRDGLYARSHASFTTSPWSKEVRQLNESIRHLIDENVFVFGEGMSAIHSIEYKKLKSAFYVFGVREGDRWYSWDEIEEWAYILGIPTVPVLFKGIVGDEKNLIEVVNELVSGDSSLGGDIEGVVVRVRDSFDDIDFKFNVQKWVRKNHVQTADKHWTRNWRKSNLDPYI